jgi:hypothetical protein
MDMRARRRRCQFGQSDNLPLLKSLAEQREVTVKASGANVLYGFKAVRQAGRTRRRPGRAGPLGRSLVGRRSLRARRPAQSAHTN